MYVLSHVACHTASNRHTNQQHIASVQAKREFKEQAATLIELRKLAEESERKEKAFSAVESGLKVSSVQLL